jgi:hypothetical protein
VATGTAGREESRALLMLKIAWHVSFRPWLWATAVRTVLRAAPTGWYRTWPFLPVPDPDYLKFRLLTMYGSEGDEPAEINHKDVILWLEWCRQWPAIAS